MLLKKLFIPLSLALLLMGTSYSAVSAQTEWTRIGQKDVDFHIDHDRIVASGKGGKFREIHLSVANAPIKFSKVTITYKGGETQTLDFLDDVQVGHESKSITIEGNGRVIKYIDVWYETDSLGGKKAKVTAYGRG
jgi:hypothetical protein